MHGLFERLLKALRFPLVCARGELEFQEFVLRSFNGLTQAHACYDLRVSSHLALPSERCTVDFKISSSDCSRENFHCRFVNQDNTTFYLLDYLFRAASIV